MASGHRPSSFVQHVDSSARDHPEGAPLRKISLRTELLVTFAVLAAGALVMAVGSALLFLAVADSRYALPFLLALIVVDVTVFVALGAHQLRRLVGAPLEAVVAAAEAVAGGDLARRIPGGPTTEFDALAASVNHMTERLLAEQARVVRAEKLASVGRLAAGVAHEIGNPLGAIAGYTHLLRKRLDGSREAADALAGLDREVDRIDHIVRGLLNYARPRSPTPARVELARVARAVVALLTDQGVLRGVDVRLELEEPGPAVVGERHELEQVFVNLLLNAIDAVNGAGTLVVRVGRAATATLEEGSARRRDDGAEARHARRPNRRLQAWLDAEPRPAEVAQVVVADSGPGVPEEDAERIFDPFFTTKEPGKGTGLGLAIVARVVDNLRGTVWVQRAREGGAAFVLLLPLPAGAGMRPVAEVA